MKHASTFAILGAVIGFALALATFGMPGKASREVDALRVEAERNQDTIAKLERESADAKARARTLEEQIASLEARLADAGLDPETEAPGSESVAAEADTATPIENFADLAREARPFLQRMAPFLDNMRKQGQQQWIAGEVAKWTEKLGLDETQAAALADRLTERADAFAAEDRARMEDESVPLTDLFAGARQWEERLLAMDDVMEETLEPDQFEQYRTDQLTQRAQTLTDRANRQLDGLTSDLSLDEGQQDQVFEILVKKSPSYDPEMQIETFGPGLDENTLGADTSQEDAIRQVLRPDQVDLYDARLERQNQRRSGWFGGLGGGS